MFCKHLIPVQIDYRTIEIKTFQEIGIDMDQVSDEWPTLIYFFRPLNMIDQLEQFQNNEIRTVIKDDERFYNASDCVIKVLGYKDLSCCRPLRKYVSNPKYCVK